MLKKLRQLQNTIAQVTEYAEKYPRDLVHKKPDGKEFSATEIIYHLLEVEELWQRRIHQLLKSDDKHFQQIDPDALAKLNAYNDQSYDDGIADWKAAREETIDLIEAMTDAECHTIGIHSRYGEMDMYRISTIMADHDIQHLRQLERTLASVNS